MPLRFGFLIILAVVITGCLPESFKEMTLESANPTEPSPDAGVQCAAVNGIKYGVNSHGISNTSLYGDYEAQFKIMQVRNLRSVRVDVNLAVDTDPYVVTRFRSFLDAAKRHCIEVNPILSVPFTWGDRTDAGQYPAGDAAALYNQGYNRTYAFVEEFRNDIKDWEFENELNLINALTGGAPTFGDGKTTVEWNVAPYTDWRHVLKGMADAVATVNADYGKTMRRVLGTTTTHFGFLSYMSAQGVNFEVISYHYYEGASTNPHLYWGTFDLFDALAVFGKPLKMNEINCNEIYDGSFVNTVGGNLYDQCATTLRTQLNYMRLQTSANIEEFTLYEMLDDPAKMGAEGRFGLMFDLLTAKDLLLMVTAFAGGTLSTAEQAQLTAKGLNP